MLNTHRNEIEITSNCDGRRKNLKDEHMKKSWENREERDRERREEWMKPCELPKLKRLFIDFPALNSNEERLPKQKQQNEMIKKKKNSVQGTSRVGQSEAAAIVNIQIRVPTWLRVRTGTLERHKYPYPCPDSDPDQALPLPLPLYPAPQALEDVCTTQLPFRWLVRKIYKLRAMRYKIQYRGRRRR